MMGVSQKGISLQINLSPAEYPLVKSMLPHQIGFFGDSVDEIVLTVETKRSQGRFGHNFDTYRDEFYQFLQVLEAENPRIRVAEVDYAPGVREKVSRMFFNGKTNLPDKDYRGGPFYCYFFGLFSCSYSTVLHLDSDIILGGNGEKWLPDAIKLLERPDILFVNPLAGPPTENFDMKQRYLQRIDQFSYLFGKVSSRLFLTDLAKLTRYKFDLDTVKPSFKNHRAYLRAVLTANRWEFPEEIMSKTMLENQLHRIDYWGDRPEAGCYSLHPEFKPPGFIEALPDLLRRVQQNDLPPAQRGRFNIHDAFFDLSAERAATKHPIKKLLGI